MSNVDSLDGVAQMTVVALRRELRRLKVRGYSGKRKTQLVKMYRNELAHLRVEEEDEETESESEDETEESGSEAEESGDGSEVEETESTISSDDDEEKDDNPTNLVPTKMPKLEKVDGVKTKTGKSGKKKSVVELKGGGVVADLGKIRLRKGLKLAQPSHIVEDFVAINGLGKEEPQSEKVMRRVVDRLEVGLSRIDKASAYFEGIATNKKNIDAMKAAIFHTNNSNIRLCNAEPDERGHFQTRTDGQSCISSYIQNKLFDQGMSLTHQPRKLLQRCAGRWVPMYRDELGPKRLFQEERQGYRIISFNFMHSVKNKEWYCFNVDSLRQYIVDELSSQYFGWTEEAEHRNLKKVYGTKIVHSIKNPANQYFRDNRERLGLVNEPPVLLTYADIDRVWKHYEASNALKSLLLRCGSSVDPSQQITIEDCDEAYRMATSDEQRDMFTEQDRKDVKRFHKHPIPTSELPREAEMGWFASKAFETKTLVKRGGRAIGRAATRVADKTRGTRFIGEGSLIRRAASTAGSFASAAWNLDFSRFTAWLSKILLVRSIVCATVTLSTFVLYAQFTWSTFAIMLVRALAPVASNIFSLLADWYNNMDTITGLSSFFMSMFSAVTKAVKTIFPWLSKATKVKEVYGFFSRVANYIGGSFTSLFASSSPTNSKSIIDMLLEYGEFGAFLRDVWNNFESFVEMAQKAWSSGTLDPMIVTYLVLTLSPKHFCSILSWSIYIYFAMTGFLLSVPMLLAGGGAAITIVGMFNAMTPSKSNATPSILQNFVGMVSRVSQALLKNEILQGVCMWITEPLTLVLRHRGMIQLTYNTVLMVTMLFTYWQNPVEVWLRLYQLCSGSSAREMMGMMDEKTKQNIVDLVLGDKEMKNPQILTMIEKKTGVVIRGKGHLEAQHIQIRDYLLNNRKISIHTDVEAGADSTTFTHDITEQVDKVFMKYAIVSSRFHKAKAVFGQMTNRVS